MGGGLWARQLGPYSCTQPFLRPGITGLRMELESFNQLLESPKQGTRLGNKAPTCATLGSQQHAALSEQWQGE